MLFKRRDPPSFGESVRVAIWPRRSWSRSTRYIMRRMWRLRGSPRAIALGFALGVFATFTPFVGFHFVIAGILAAISRASIIASAFGTFIGNPLTFPFIWIGTYRFGNVILGTSGKFSGRELRERFADIWSGIVNFSPETMGVAIETVWPLIKPMLVGGIPLGILVGALSYSVVRRMVEAYQSEHQRVQPKARQREFIK